MIRIFKLVLLLVVSQVAFGQAPSNYTNINGRYRWIAGMFDSTFHIPKGTSPSLRTGGSTNAGGLFYNTSDSSVYTYTGTQWIKARGSINPSDTTNKYVTQVYKKNGSDSVFYVKGGNHLFAFIDSVGSPGGGGGGKIYYFNGGVNMGTIGGLQMYELGDTANTGAAANFTRSTTGNIANFITDSGKPGLVQIPAGVWSVDAWLSETGGGANHAEIWIEVEKWDGSTITTIATSPIEQITEGSTPNLYSWSVSIPTTSLTVTDRIIIQFYISNTNGKTVTLYTQNGYVGEVHTTFTTGIGAINGLTAPAQYLVTGTSGTDFNINSVTATHTFNLPTASATNRGALSSTDWTTFNSKIGGSGTTNYVSKFTGSGTIGNSQIFDNATSVGIGTAFPSASYKLDVNGNINVSNAVNYSQGGTKYGWTYATSGAMAMEGLQGADISLGTGSGAVATERMVIKNSGIVGIGITPDSMFTVAQGTHLQRGVRMSGLPSAVGTKTLRIDASGTVSVADTLANGVSGSGTTNRVSKFTSSGVIGNSSIVDSSSIVALTISSAANIGLGITPSPWNIGFGSSYKALQFSNGVLNSFTGLNEQMNLALNWYYDNGDKYYANGAASIYQQSNGDHFWYTAPSGTANSAVTFTNRLALFNDGRLQVGAVVSDSLFAVKEGVQFFRGVRLSGLPTAPGTRALRINANGTLSVSDTLTNGISGSGTTNYIPKFTSSSAIGNSIISEASGVINVAGNLATNNTNGILTFANGNTSGGNKIQSFNSIGNANGYLAFEGYSAEYMRLDASGNLGLGTSNPLSVASTKIFTIYDASEPRIQFLNSTSGTASTDGASIATNGTDFYINNRENGNLLFYNNGAARATIDASGNLGLGVTPSPWSVYKSFDIETASLSAAGVQVEMVSNAYFNGSNWIYKSSTFPTRYVQNSGAAGGHSWFTAASGTAGNAISFTQAMTLDADGDLGIGTTNPTYKLDVVQNTAQVVTRLLNQATTTTSIASDIIAANNGTVSYQLDVDGLGTAFGAGALMGTTTNHFVGFRTNNTERMRITSGGNVGIGSTTASGFTRTLKINTTSGTAGLLLADGDTDRAGFYIDAGTTAPAYLFTNDSKPLVLSVAGAERMRITSGGNVLVGRNTNAAAGWQMAIKDGLTVTDGTYEVQLFGYFGAGVGTFTNHDFTFRTNNTEKMRITSGGEVYIAGTTDQGAYNLQVNGTGVWGAGAYVDGSDSAVKKNIQPLGSSLDLIKQMNPVTFEYQPFYSKDTTTQTGFIAQELQQVLSDKVYKNGIVKEGGQYLGVAYQHLIPLLVKAIQELEAKVENLKTQLNNR